MSLIKNPLPIVRPITDLRTNLKEVVAQAEELNEPILLTKNGELACALVSIKALEQEREEHERELRRIEAEVRARYEGKSE